MHGADWPELRYGELKDTCETLQLWTQVIGKVRLALTPWLNHSWHVPLYVTAHGLGTGLIPSGARPLEIEFDFIGQALRLRRADGGSQALPLRAGSIAGFYADVREALAALGVTAAIHPIPNELPDPIPFAEDVAPRVYEPDQALRFWLALAQAWRVFSAFRTGFLGKASPVHFFWGSFDLAVTRFSGRPAPAHPGGVPHLPDAVAREAYSHEVSSAGFWPGGGAIDYPAFYSYAYPEPAGFRAAVVSPAGAFFHEGLGEFILPYEAVRGAADPDAALLAFLQSTYAAAADLGGWDRAALECDLGRPGVVRPV
jgi:hypothetical protein